MAAIEIVRAIAAFPSKKQVQAGRLACASYAEREFGGPGQCALGGEPAILGNPVQKGVPREKGPPGSCGERAHV